MICFDISIFMAYEHNLHLGPPEYGIIILFFLGIMCMEEPNNPTPYFGLHAYSLTDPWYALSNN